MSWQAETDDGQTTLACCRLTPAGSASLDYKGCLALTDRSGFDSWADSLLV